MEFDSREVKNQPRMIELITDRNMFARAINYIPFEIRDPGYTLLHAIIWGAMTQLSIRTFDWDAMITQLLRERTKLCLDKVPDMKMGVIGLKKIVSNREDEGKDVPKFLMRYIKGKKSFTGYILDMKISFKEFEELLNMVQTHRR